MKFKRKECLIHKIKQNPVNAKRAHEYSYQGKSEKNRKKKIYIARLKRNYQRSLKEYEQGNIRKRFWISEDNSGSSLSLNTKHSPSLSTHDNDELQNKNDLSLKKKQPKKISRYLKEEKKANAIRLEKESLIMQKKYKEEEKQRRIGERIKKYKIMTQVTKKGQPKLNKRIGLLLDKVKEIMKK
ncbi:uncharacterized protein T551_00313 [Pneumocystis jirovecii RU7]|uniref:rRNA-processing protein FYV7 n=1 Tax=Pneumocystis jirovecii (strain RU7) TaxID=1408657 RepID=A0A0W4ZWS5_PNEJ7|nr:uncharacterized protein T551_00313 [Pneumocystis jirovecii RU7]KTW32828.1 hypothetical protein T551_00313 [Pneumocystis jirovecii RU7]